MSSLAKTLTAGWLQFWTERGSCDRGLLDLVVNLACLGRLRLAEFTRIIVLVDSRQAAMLLRLLRLGAAIPWCRVRVVHRPDDLRDLSDDMRGAQALLVVASQLFLKQHQAVVALRRQSSVIVI